MSDKWEPTVYTLTDLNPQNHICKVTDESGKTKVVHRNLMLDVSFLPVPGQTSEELDSGVSDEVCDFQSLSIVTLSSLAVEASEDRTQSWICVSPVADYESVGADKESVMENEMSCSPSRDFYLLAPERPQPKSASDCRTTEEMEHTLPETRSRS